MDTPTPPECNVDDLRSDPCPVAGMKRFGGAEAACADGEECPEPARCLVDKARRRFGCDAVRIDGALGEGYRVRPAGPHATVLKSGAVVTEARGG